jgi:hypothetical protein
MLSRRIQRAASLSAALVSVSLASCGGPQPPAPQAPAAPASSAAVAPPPPPPPDLGAVPDPVNLTVSGRLATPGASLALVHRWSQLPLVQADQVTELLAGEALGPIVDLDAPIDFAVATVGEGMRMRGLLAVSAGVRDGEAARAALGERYKLVPAGNGALLIQGLGRAHRRDDEGDPDDGGGNDRTCELAPSSGTPTTRLVCAWDPKALSELGPWLTRTAPRAASRGDLSVDVRMQSLRSTLVGFKRMASVLLGGLLGGRATAQGTRDALLTVAGDLLDFAIDLDVLSLQVDLTDVAAQARATMKFAGATSTLTRMAMAHADGGATPPAPFWQLPPDADVAVFDRGVDPADLARVVRVALKLLDQVLADAGLKDVDRKALLDALGKIPPSAPVVYASGLDAAAVEKAVEGAKDATAAKPSAQALAEGLLGWRLVEIDEPSARLAGVLKELVAAWGRPGIAAAYAAGAKGSKPPTVRAQPLPRGVALPKGTLHYALALPVARDKAAVPAKPGGPSPGPLTVHLLLAPDGPRAWLAIGGDVAALASKLAGAVGAAGTVRPDLAALDHAKVGAAGFVDVRSLPEVALQLAILGAEPVPGLLAALEHVATLPHRGLTPVVFSLTAQPDASVVATLQVPRDAIEDAIVAGLSRVSP